MNSELKTMWMGAMVTCFNVLSHYSPEGSEEDKERTIFRIAGVLAEIRTSYLTHKNYMCYILNEFGELVQIWKLK
jgi:hypothetical protein